MNEHGGTAVEPEQGAPGTVWRVSLAWPAIDDASRQERIDGLQQLLAARSVVGLMGPGRPTRGGLIVDLVFPVDQAKVLFAKRDGVLESGDTGEEFAAELHRYTGAVVVNGDVARGDFAVLASADDLSDEDLAALLDEPLQNVLLVGTAPADDVREISSRLQLPGWLAEADRPVFAVPAPSSDPTSMVMPGPTGVSLALRERPGRVDVMLWGVADSDEPARPTRRRRSARRSALVSTHLGARCLPIVLPEYVRPAGSDVANLMLRLEEDFAPLASDALGRLGRVLPAVQVDALAKAVNEAPTRGFDPEGGVLAPEVDGLLPGQEVPQEAERAPHADAAAVLSGLGEDPDWVELLSGRAPDGIAVEALLDPVPGEEEDDAPDAVDQPDPAQDDDATRIFEKNLAPPDEDATITLPAATDIGPTASEHPDDVEHPDADQEATEALPHVQDPAGHLPTLSQAGDPQAKAELESREQGGGFTSHLSHAAQQEPEADFDSLVAPSSAVAQEPPTKRGKRRKVGVPEPQAPELEDEIPQPRPAAGTPASSAGDDLGRPRRKAWPLVLLIVGIVVFVAAAVLAFMAPQLGVAIGTGYLVAGAAGVIGIGAAVVGWVNLGR